uniref:CLIP domain-containing serine protease n=1 Tax=Hirondellea gigas TaxID=1518452 RepID=A0A2P2HYT0_9CRUS
MKRLGMSCISQALLLWVAFISALAAAHVLAGDRSSRNSNRSRSSSNSCHNRETCVPVRQCPILLRLLRSRSALDRRAVRRAICGYEGINAKVCCRSPSTSVIAVPEESFLSTSERVPPPRMPEVQPNRKLFREILQLEHERPSREPFSLASQFLTPTIVLLTANNSLENQIYFPRHQTNNVHTQIDTSRKPNKYKNPDYFHKIPVKELNNPNIPSNTFGKLNRVHRNSSENSTGERNPSRRPTDYDDEEQVDRQTDALLPRPDQCVSQINRLRIYGGTAAVMASHPWLAAIMYTRGSHGQSSIQCSGALINDRYVVTAAHCLDTRETANMKLSSVVLGEWDASTDPDCVHGVCTDPVLKFGVAEAVIHPQYNKRFRYASDIALLRLNAKVTFSKFVKPLCLPPLQLTPEMVAVGAPTTVAGWGATRTHKSSNVLQEVTLNIANPYTCKRIFPRYFDVNGPQICIGGNSGEDTCKGDSGSPVVQTTSSGYQYLLAVTSYGSPTCGREDYPAVYTSVAHYVKWIRQTIRQ